MDNKETKQMLEKVAGTILQDPIRLEVDVIPQGRFHRWRQKKGISPKTRVFEITPITLGNLVRISKVLLSIDLSIFDVKNLLQTNYQLIEKYSVHMATIAAIAIHNRKDEPADELVEFIMTHFTAHELAKVIGAVLTQMDLKSFMNTIVSVRGMNLLQTSPKSQRS